MLLTAGLGRGYELAFGGIAMLKRSFAIFVVPAFACGMLSAQEVSPSQLHQPTLTSQNSGTTNGLIAVWRESAGGLGIRPRRHVHCHN